MMSNRNDASGIEYMKSKGYPQPVIDFFRKLDIADEYLEINGVRINHSVDLMEENEDAVPGCAMLPFGYLNIASTKYGDVYCLDTNTKNAAGEPVVVIASHEEISEDSTEEEIKESIIHTADSFTDFIDKFNKGELPSQYYDVNPAQK